MSEEKDFILRAAHSLRQVMEKPFVPPMRVSAKSPAEPMSISPIDSRKTKSDTRVKVGWA